MVRIPSISKQKVKDFEEIEETTGLLKKDYDENKLMSSVRFYYKKFLVYDYVHKGIE